MKSKIARQQQEAGKAAFKAYLDTLATQCHADDPTLACPDCVHAYEHALRYYHDTYQETP